MKNSKNPGAYKLASSVDTAIFRISLWFKYPPFRGKFAIPLPPQQQHSKPQLSCPPSAVRVQCDRALVRNARGTKVARYKKFATTASHKFFRSRACFRSKTACTLRCRRAGRAADRAQQQHSFTAKAQWTSRKNSHHQRLLLHRLHLLLQHLHLAFPVIAAAKPREVDGEGGVGPAAGQPGAVVDEAQGAQGFD
jgi:hypothetical protein